MITAERLRTLFLYYQETGAFLRLVSMSNRSAGEIVFGTPAFSYGKPIGRKMGIDGQNYYAHRLAWLYMHGAWPALKIDHKNGDPFDNRWENLREATNSQNAGNMRRHRRSLSGLKGAYPHYGQPGKWVAIICKDRHQTYLGTFDSADAAHAAYCAAGRRLFGEFFRAA